MVLRVLRQNSLKDANRFNNYGNYSRAKFLGFHNVSVKEILIKNGNFRLIFMLLFVMAGGFLIFVAGRISSYWLGIFGMVLCSVGGYAGRARSLGIKPFSHETKWLSKRDSGSS